MDWSGNLIGHAAKEILWSKWVCSCVDVSKKKKRDEIGKSCSEHQRSLLWFLLFFVHILVKLGGRCGSRCTLLLYSERPVKLTSAKSICRKVWTTCMLYGDEEKTWIKRCHQPAAVSVMWSCKSGVWEKKTCCDWLPPTLIDNRRATGHRTHLKTPNLNQLIKTFPTPSMQCQCDLGYLARNVSSNAWLSQTFTKQGCFSLKKKNGTNTWPSPWILLNSTFTTKKTNFCFSTYLFQATPSSKHATKRIICVEGTKREHINHNCISILGRNMLFFYS